MSKVLGYGRPHFPQKTRDDTCPTCNGRGYTRKTAPIIKDKVTLALGSGCPECKGLGKVA